MFKRSTKITSLLVAAASVISMVPAMAADVTRAESETGNVYDAVAYKDGKAVIAGEIKDEDKAFYYSDGNFKEVDSIDSGAKLEAYGEKYAKADDGDYFVDLTSGKVTEDVDDDDEDKAASALRSKVKKADRYGENSNTPKLTRVSGNKYGESWYYTNENEYKVDETGKSAQLFTDKDGKYIDADYNLGKIKVKVTAPAAKKTVSDTDKDGQKTKVSDTISDTINVEDTDKDGQKTKVSGVTLKVTAEVTPKKVLGQDKDNIYRFAEIKLTASADNGEVARFEEVFGSDKLVKKTASEDGKVVTLKVVQKISKAQSSDEKDDAKYAKTVNNYVLSNDDADTENDDVKDLIGLLEDEDAKATVADGRLVVYKVNSDSATSEALQVQSFALKQKSGLYYTDCKGNKKFDVEYSDDLDAHAVDVDVDGNIWFVDSGYVKKFDNKDDADKVYKVDGSINAISVYDKNNMVVWSTDDDVYSIVGKKEEEKEKPVDPTPAVTAGWNQAADGTYTYINADGTKKTGWFFDPAYNHYYYLDPATGVMKANTWFFDPAYGKYYYLDGSGAMMANTWFFDPAYGHYYYFDGSGAMQTGWFYDGYNWYYADASGAMLANTTVDGYVLGASGAWIQ